MDEITQKVKKKFGLSSTRECFPFPGMLLEFGVSLFTVSLWSFSPLEYVLLPRTKRHHGSCLAERLAPSVTGNRSAWGSEVPNEAGPARSLSAVPGPALLGAGVGGQGVKGHRSLYPGLAGAGAARTGHRPGFLAERPLPSHLATVRLFAPLGCIPEVVFSHNCTRRWTRHNCRDSSLRVRGTPPMEGRVRGSGPSGKAREVELVRGVVTQGAWPMLWPAGRGNTFVGFLKSKTA